jgi:hypothetical protein
MTRQYLVVLAMTTLATFTSAAQADDMVLECSNGSTSARSALRKAPLGAKRPGKHLLVVRWQHGSQNFEDTPPHEPLAGTHYRYCDYSTQAHLHLIGKQQDAMRTGMLLNDETGQLTPAGNRVIVSPDQHLYFAQRQPDGLDGEEWLVYHSDGSVLWQGFSGIEDKPGSNWLAVLDDPHWTNDNKLQAKLTCAAYIANPRVHKTIVTLESKDGSYQWWPKIACPRLK